MKKLIITLSYQHLRNEIHVELHDAINVLFGTYPPATLGIQAQYDVYKPLYDEEVSALDIVFKSEKTAEINAQDNVRDGIYRGFTNAVKSALYHFDDVKRSAAQKIFVALEHYGNIAAKTYDSGTAAYDDLLRELSGASVGKWNADVQTLDLGDWLTQLAEENQKFKELMTERYSEQAQRPTVRMRQARKAVDAAFREMTSQVEALAMVNGTAPYESFAKQINAILERYRNIMAQQEGRRAADRSPKDKSIE